MGRLTLIRCEPQEMMDEVEEQLYRSLVADPFGAVVILPSGAAQRQAVDRILKRGIVLLGDPVCTLDDMARNVFDSCRVKEMPIDREESELMIKAVMDDNRSSLPEFEPLREGIVPTVSELRALFDTWRQFLVNENMIISGMDSVADHIYSIFKEYQERSAGSNLYDNVGVMEWAIRCIAEKRVQFKKVWMVGLNELNPLEQRLVKAVWDSSEELVFIIRNDGGKTFQEDLTWLPADETKAKECPPAENFERFRGRAQLRTRVFADPLAEARVVAGEVRQLIDSGTKPSEICIMLPMREKSAPLFRSMLEESGVWCNLDVPIPLTRSPIVQVMLNLLECVNQDMPRELIIRLLSSPYVRFRYGEKMEPSLLNGGMVGSYAVQAGVIEGTAQWKEKLALLRQDLEEEASSPEVPAERSKQLKEKALRVTSIASGLDNLFSLLNTIKGSMTAEERIARLKPVLKRLEVEKHLAHVDERIYEKEARSLKAFFQVLDTLVSFESFNPVGREELSSFVSRVRVLCSNSENYVEPAYTEAVLVTGLRAATLTRHDQVFIVGMVEGDLPFLGAGNPFIDDLDIKRWGLLSRSDILRQERLYFLSALETAKKSVSLSCYRSNDGSKVVSSSFFDEIVRALSPPSFGEKDFHSSQISEQKALGEAVARKRQVEGIELSIQISPEELLRCINVEAFHRVNEYDSPFDGVLNDEQIIHQLSKMVGPERVFSPTELEIYASCPLSFYLNRVLRIEPRPELEMEITGKDQGTFVHAVAFHLYSQLRSNGMMMTLDKLDAIENLAQTIAKAEMTKMKFSGPAWEAFQARMIGSKNRKGLLRAFLEFETENPTPFIPSHFELSFGRAKPDSCDPASKDTPVDIELGDGSNLRLAGRVDRVDVDSDGKFLIIDYKTGVCPKLSEVKEGKSLQVQLYLQAVQKLLKKSSGVGGIFYQVKNEAELDYATIVVDEANFAPLKPIIGRKRYLDIPIDELVRETNLLVVRMLADMRQGVFHPAMSERDCKPYCQYRQICRFDPLRVMDMEGE